MTRSKENVSTIGLAVDVSDVQKNLKLATDSLSTFKSTVSAATKTAKLDPSNIQAQVKAYDALDLNVKKYGTAIDAVKAKQQQLLNSNPANATSSEYTKLQRQAERLSSQQISAQARLQSQSISVAKSIKSSGQPLESMSSKMQTIYQKGTTTATNLDRLNRVKLSTLANSANSVSTSVGRIGSTADTSDSKLSKMGSSFKTFVTGTVIGNTISKGVSAVTGSINAAVSRVDTLNNYPKIMKQMGFASDDAAESMTTLKKGIDGLPTRLDDIAKSSQSFAILQKDAKKGASTAIALNDAFLASGASSEDASRGVQQYSQMLASGTVDLQSWRTLQETMPYALTQVAKSFGLTGKSAEIDLYKKLKAGNITMEELNERFTEIDQSADGFAKTARTATGGIGTSFANLKTAIVNAVAEVIKKLSDAGLTTMIDKITQGIRDAVPTIVKFSQIIIDVLVASIKGAVSFLKEFWEILKNTGALGAIQDAVSSLGKAFKNLTSAGGSGHVPLLEVLMIASAEVIKGVALAVKAVADALASLSPGQLQATTFALGGLIGAIVLLRTVTKITYGILAFKTSLEEIGKHAVLSGSKVKSMFAKIAGVKPPEGLTTTKNTTEAIGTAASQSSGKMASFTQSLGAGFQSLLKAGGVALIAVSLAYSLTLVADAVQELSSLSWGQLAVGLAGVTGALIALVAAAGGLAFIGQTFGAGALMITPLLLAVDGFVLSLGYLLNSLANLSTQVPAFLNTLLPAFMNFYNQFNAINWYEVFGHIMQGMLSGLMGSINTVATYGPALVQAFVGMILNVESSIANNTYRLYNGTFQMITKSIKGLSDAIAQNYTKIIDAGYTLVNTTAKALGYAVGRANFAEIGAYVVQGFWQGITHNWDSTVTSGLGKLASNLTKPVRKALGIASPSKVFRQLGAWTTEGFAIGIDSNTGKVDESMHNMISSVNSASDSVIIPSVNLGDLSTDDNNLNSLNSQIQASLNRATFNANVNTGIAIPNNNRQQTSNQTSNSFEININQQPGQSSQSLVDQIINEVNGRFA